MKEAHGEYISLQWDCIPTEHYVKGHVGSSAAIKEVMANHDDYFPQGFAAIAARPRWAKWVKVGPNHEDYVDGCDFTFRVIGEQRAGYFPVMEVYDPTLEAKP